MLVPRAYGLSSGKKQRKVQEKGLSSSPVSSAPHDERRAFGWRPESYKFAPTFTIPPGSPGSSFSGQATEARIRSQSPPPPQFERDSAQSVLSPPQNPSSGMTRSLPMAVPIPAAKRTHFKSTADASSTSSSMPRSTVRRPTTKHDPDAMSPAVAALLAMTSIPRQRPQKKSPPSQQTRKANTVPRRLSTQQLMDYWKQDHDLAASLETGSSLDILLSPPDQEEMLSRSVSSGTLETYMRVRSFSSESLLSMSADDQSVLSWSQPSTPRTAIRRPHREKAASPPKSYESVIEHPLSLGHTISEESDEVYTAYSSRSSTPDATPQRLARSPSPRAPSSFKSNLTASLSALRSSLRSLSNFAITPYALPEDHVSRGLFADAQRITSEMRPRPLDGPPTAELRRYLNPSAFRYSPSRDFHLHGTSIEHVDYEGLAVSSVGLVEKLEPGSVIALQDRMPTAESRLPRAEGCGGSGDSTPMPGQGDFSLPLQHRREIRENGEFLRICVLETNMRRVGKMEGPLRAKIWLPPRQVGVMETARAGYAMSGGRGVPTRWVGVSAAY